MRKVRSFKVRRVGYLTIFSDLGPSLKLELLIPNLLIFVEDFGLHKIFRLASVDSYEAVIMWKI